MHSERKKMTIVRAMTVFHKSLLKRRLPSRTRAPRTRMAGRGEASGNRASAYPGPQCRFVKMKRPSKSQKRRRRDRRHSNVNNPFQRGERGAGGPIRLDKGGMVYLWRWWKGDVRGGKILLHGEEGAQIGKLRVWFFVLRGSQKPTQIDTKRH